MTKSIPSGSAASARAISMKESYDRSRYHAAALSRAMVGFEDMAPATSSASPSSCAAIRCTPPMNEPRPPPTMPARRRPSGDLCCMVSSDRSGTKGLAPDTLNGYALRREHLVLQRVHRRSRLVDRPRKGKRAGEYGRQLSPVLYPRLGVFVLDHQERLSRVDTEQFTGGQLMVEPVHGSVLQVRERIMARRAWQLVFTEHCLLLPGIDPIRRNRRGRATDPVAAFHGLAAVAPCRDSARIDHLTFDVKSGDQKVVAGVLEILKYRTRILSDQDGMRRVVVDAELIPHLVAFADFMQGDPRTRCVGNVVVPAVGDLPARHRALLDTIGQPPGLGLLEQGDELGLEHLQVGIHFQLRIAPDESADGIRTEQYRGIEYPHHEFVLLAAYRRICGEHIVEVRQIREPNAGLTHRRVDARGARAI